MRIRNDNQMAALDYTFDAFVLSLYENNVVPAFALVPSMSTRPSATYLRRCGYVPILQEDESTECPVFGNWNVHYAFHSWLKYREIHDIEPFPGMARDILKHKEWSIDAAYWLTITYGLAVMQGKYADKFGHYPADLHKFIKSYIRNGEATVLRRDVF